MSDLRLRRARRWWFLMKLHHPLLRSRRLRRRLRESNRRLADAQSYALFNEVSLAAAIEQLYGDGTVR